MLAILANITLPHFSSDMLLILSSDTFLVSLRPAIREIRHARTDKL